MKPREGRGRLYACLFFFTQFGNPPIASDLFETVTGLDYARHLWMGTDPCTGGDAAAAVLPDFSSRSIACPSGQAATKATAFTVAWTQGYRRLLKKDASAPFHFAHEDAVSTLHMRLRHLDLLEARSSLERTGSERTYRDGDLGQELDETTWVSHNALEITVKPWFVPTVAVSAGSSERRETLLGLHGRLSGFSWSTALGRGERRLPLTLDLEDYRPMQVPILQRYDRRTLSGSWRGERWEVSWTDRRLSGRHPGTFEPEYSFSDSGKSAEILGGIGYSDSSAAGRFHAALEGGRLYGSRVFRGVRASPSPYQFSYIQSKHDISWSRFDMHLARSRLNAGAFVGISTLNGEIIRPQTAAGRHFWDRNGVLDSYEGNVLNLFSRETWLFDGAFRFRQVSAGSWVELPVSRWRLRPGMTLHVADMDARGHLTKRNTTLLIAFTEKDYRLAFNGVEAVLLTPELGITRQSGRASLEFSLAQAVPLRVHVRGIGGGEGGSDDPVGYSGGTRGELKVKWNVF